MRTFCWKKEPFGKFRKRKKNAAAFTLDVNKTKQKLEGEINTSYIKCFLKKLRYYCKRNGLEEYGMEYGSIFSKTTKGESKHTVDSKGLVFLYRKRLSPVNDQFIILNTIRSI